MCIEVKGRSPVGAHPVRDKPTERYILAWRSRTGCAPTDKRARRRRPMRSEAGFARRLEVPLGYAPMEIRLDAPRAFALGFNATLPPSEAISLGYFSLLRASCPPPFGPASPFARAPARAWANKEKVTRASQKGDWLCVGRSRSKRPLRPTGLASRRKRPDRVSATTRRSRMTSEKIRPSSACAQAHSTMPSTPPAEPAYAKSDTPTPAPAASTHCCHPP